MALDKDGVMPERHYQLKVKYNNYAQGAYSVCIPTINNTKKLIFLSTFDYTGKKLVSVNDGNKIWETELMLVQQCGGVWSSFNGANPYLERFGTEEKRRMW